MPSYDYRCKTCGRENTLFYKSYAAYDAATPTCPQCGSTDMTRLIRRVAIQSPTRDYTGMSSQEMLSVLESGDSRQVGEMFKQVGGDATDLPDVYKNTTDRLLRGDKMEQVERDLRSSTPPPDSGAAGGGDTTGGDNTTA
jgi:putative FmdB family regulatory protein